MLIAVQMLGEPRQQVLCLSYVCIFEFALVSQKYVYSTFVIRARANLKYALFVLCFNGFKLFPIRRHCYSLPQKHKRAPIAEYAIDAE